MLFSVCWARSIIKDIHDCNCINQNKREIKGARPDYELWPVPDPVDQDCPCPSTPTVTTEVDTTTSYVTNSASPTTELASSTSATTRSTPFTTKSVSFTLYSTQSTATTTTASTTTTSTAASNTEFDHIVYTTTVPQPDPTPEPYILFVIPLIITLLAVCYMIYAFFFKSPKSDLVVDSMPETTPCQQEQENFLPQQQVQQHVQQQYQSQM